MNTPSKEALEAAIALLNGFTIGFADGLFKPNTSHLAGVIDRHFEPLRQRAEQTESISSAAKRSIENAHAALDKSAMLMPRDKSHQGLTPRIKCLVARAEQAEARVKELEATCAELVTDGNAVTLAANLAKQSARVNELAVALREALSHMNELIDVIDRAQESNDGAERMNEFNLTLAREVHNRLLARHAAGEPAKDAVYVGPPSGAAELTNPAGPTFNHVMPTSGTLPAIVEPAKHPDTERLISAAKAVADKLHGDMGWSLHYTQEHRLLTELTDAIDAARKEVQT